LKNETGRTERILLYTDRSEVGRILLAELLERTPAEIVLAGRSERWLEAAQDALGPERAARVTPFVLDARDGRAVRAVVERVQVAVCALAPFRPVTPAIAQAALCSGVDYVDLSGRRESVRRVSALALELQPEDAGPAVAAGFSLTALAGALAALVVRGLDEVEALRIALVPGPGFPASRRERAHVLRAASRPFRLARRGVWCTVPAWSDPAAFRFPPPLGTRDGRLVDGPDCELFPELFGAARVELRLDTQGFSGPGLELLARLRGAGVPFGSRWLADALALADSLLGGSQAPAAALGVEVEGRFGKHPLRVRGSLVDGRGHARLAVLPAAHLVERLIANPGALRGRVPHHTWIESRDLPAECARLGIALAVAEQ